MLTFEHPAVDSLVEIERARRSYVCLNVLEPCLLQGTVRRYIECIGLAVEQFELQHIKVDIDAHPEALRTDAAIAVIGRDDVQMHIRAFIKNDLVGRGESDEAVVVKPAYHEGGPALDGQRVFALVPFAPRGCRRQSCGIHAQHFQVLRRSAVKVINDGACLLKSHWPDVDAYLALPLRKPDKSEPSAVLPIPAPNFR